jgi:endonuclease-3
LESLAKRRKRAEKICAILSGEYPDARCTLDHSNAYELLVATILAAQCTDERVNTITPSLFVRYPDAKSLARANEKKLQGMIKSTGFFRNKARNLVAMAKRVVAEHGGEIPGDIGELSALAGVGRKTANVVIANCFGGEAIIVDTHLKRLSGRLGFSDETDPDKIELDVQKAVAPDKWTEWSHLMVFHGRNVCVARKPKCPECLIERLCPWKSKTA